MSMGTTINFTDSEFRIKNPPSLRDQPELDFKHCLNTRVRLDYEAARYTEKLRFQGAVGDFPAFQACVSFNNDPPLTLFRRRPVAPSC